MQIKLNKGASGEFEPTPPEKILAAVREPREMGGHQNSPISNENIFKAANEGYASKQAKEDSK